MSTFFIDSSEPEVLPTPQIGFNSTPSPEEIFRTSNSELHEVKLVNCEENSVFEKIRKETKLTEEDLLAILCQGLAEKGLNQINSCPNISKRIEMDKTIETGIILLILSIHSTFP